MGHRPWSGALLALLVAPAAHAQDITGVTDQKAIQSLTAPTPGRCAIAKHPDPLKVTTTVSAMCESATPTNDLVFARSTDLGMSWSPTTTLGSGIDPSMAWDAFGNLFLVYTDAAQTKVTLTYSSDDGVSFNTTPIKTWTAQAGGHMKRPDVAVAPPNSTGAPNLWVTWQESGGTLQDDTPMAAGALALGTVAAKPINFAGAPMPIPGTGAGTCRFGDIAVDQTGRVAHVCEALSTAGTPSPELHINVLAAGASAFQTVFTFANTGVGTSLASTTINQTIDSSPSLAFNLNTGTNPFNVTMTQVNRLFLAYTGYASGNSGENTDIFYAYSDDGGGTWSTPAPASNVAANTLDFYPRVANNSDSGNFSLCWYNVPAGAAAPQVMCNIFRDPQSLAPVPLLAGAISDDSLNGTAAANANFIPIDVAYYLGRLHPIWGNLAANTNAWSDKVGGGTSAQEGDPHITTVDGTHYDFQGAGEYVSLIDGDSMQIQTRQTPVATSFFPGPNAYTGLASCVSLNTAVAALVGKHRVTYEPNLSGQPDPSGMQLRIDGKLTELGANPIELEGGRVLKVPAGNGIEIDFPDDTVLLVTANWWASEQKWYLNVDVPSSPGTSGLMGRLAPASWLPALPNGQSLGQKPEPLAERYNVLYKKFGDAWRVTAKTSLFDYAPGTGPATFVRADWPQQQGPCTIEGQPTANPTDAATAKKACAAVTDANRNSDCVFDVMVTGELGFANSYKNSQNLDSGVTTTFISDANDPTRERSPATFTSSVIRVKPGKVAVTGAVQFMVDGAAAGAPIALDGHGRAVWKTSDLPQGAHKISAAFVPSGGFLPSRSTTITHTVAPAKCGCSCDVGGGSSPGTPAAALLLLIAFAWRLRRRAD